MSRVFILLGYLERNLKLLDRIVGTVDISQRPGRYAPENAVFADSLAGSKQDQALVRTRRTASFQPSSNCSR